jgi:WD40 repeat protein
MSNSNYDVFISYARADNRELFITHLKEALEDAELNVWIDKDDIPLSAEWWQEICRGIEASHNFVAIISPNFVKSEVCRREVDYAVQKHKRFVPVLRADPNEKADLHPHLGNFNWVYIRENDAFEQAVGQLIKTLRTDLDYLRIHTRLTTRAEEWRASNKNSSYTLRGDDLRDAEKWLANEPWKIKNAEQNPPPTPIHREYVLASRQATQQRQRITAFVVGITLIFVGILAVFGYNQFVNTQIEATRAANAQATANVEGTSRAVQQVIAVREAAISESRRLANEALTILNDPAGNPETSALLSVHALSKAYTEQADATLVQSVDRLYVRKVFVGHQDDVFDAAFSSDGRYITTVGRGVNGYIWDMATGTQIYALTGHTHLINSVDYSPDGELILTASIDGTARIWDAVSGQQIRVIQASDDALNDANFSSDGQFIVTGGDDEIIRVWEVLTGEQIISLEGHTSVINSVAFSPNSQFIVSASADETARIWKMPTGFQHCVLEGHQGDVNEAAFSPDGRFIVTAGGDFVDRVDDTARTWDASTCEQQYILQEHTLSITGASYSPDGRRIITSSDDDTVMLWDSETGERINYLVGHDDRVNSVAFSADGQFIVTASRDHTARVWQSPESVPPRVYSGVMAVVAYSPDGRLLAIVDEQSIVHVLDAETGQELSLVDEHVVNAGTLSFSPDGLSLAIGSFDSAAYIWNIETDELIHLQGHEEAVHDINFSPDGRQVITGSRDNTSRIWDAATGEPIRTMTEEDWITSAAFSPDGRFILTANLSGFVSIWNADTGENVTVITAHEVELVDAVYSPDGQYIVTVSYDATARVWDAKTYRRVATLVGHTDFLNGAAYSPSGRFVATISSDQTARIWNTQTWETVRVLHGHSDELYGVAFHPNGQFVLTGSVDGTARLWDVDYQDFMEYACSRIFSDFTVRNSRASHYGIPDTPICVEIGDLNR